MSDAVKKKSRHFAYIQDVNGTLPGSTTKKGDAAKMAEQAVAGTGWLPKPLRSER